MFQSSGKCLEHLTASYSNDLCYAECQLRHLLPERHHIFIIFLFGYIYLMNGTSTVITDTSYAFQGELNHMILGPSMEMYVLIAQAIKEGLGYIPKMKRNKTFQIIVNTLLFICKVYETTLDKIKYNWLEGGREMF